MTKKFGGYMTKKLTAYEQGIKWGSCKEALEERKKYKTQEEWYKNCKRGDWLFWQLKRLTNEQFNNIKPLVLKVNPKGYKTI
jgi:hypothetical protein